MTAVRGKRVGNVCNAKHSWHVLVNMIIVIITTTHITTFKDLILAVRSGLNIAQSLFNGRSGFLLLDDIS